MVLMFTGWKPSLITHTCQITNSKSITNTEDGRVAKLKARLVKLCLFGCEFDSGPGDHQK